MRLRSIAASLAALASLLASPAAALAGVITSPSAPEGASATFADGVWLWFLNGIYYLVG